MLPGLEYSNDKKEMFRNFVNKGREITVPQRNVSIGGWTGTGYIVMNQDGTGAYMISGGLAGGLIVSIFAALLLILVVLVKVLVVVVPIIIVSIKAILYNIALLIVAVPFLCKSHPNVMNKFFGGLAAILPFSIGDIGNHIFLKGLSSILTSIAVDKFVKLMQNIADLLTLGYLYNKATYYA